MMVTTTITKKGQVTIPTAIRKALGIKPQDKVAFIEHGNEFVIRQAIDFFSLRRSIKTKKPFDIKAMERAARKQAVSHFPNKK